MTDAYKQHSGKVSAPVLRALSFQHVLAHKTIVINPHELIVGERGEAPQVAPTYPELCCHTLDDLRVMSERERISFQVDQVALQTQAEVIIPYWQGRSMRDIIFSHMDSAWHDCYAAGVFTEFMEQRAPGHTVGDDKIFQVGILDHISRIDNALSSMDYLSDLQAYEKAEQLKAMAICARAITHFAERHAQLATELAMELAIKEPDASRRRELEQIAAICVRVPAHAPQTFWEALQAYWFVHLGVITELNTWDAFSPGRLDQHLLPFYRQGIADGTLTRDSAKELLQCFWVKFNNQPAPPKVGITLLESGTYTDFASINLGGLKADGADGVNEVTYLLLEVIQEMRLLQPSTNIQVSKKSPDLFLHKAGEIIRTGFGQPSVFNADAVVQELLRQGKSIEDARLGGTSGCVETGAFGKEAYILTGYFNLVKILEVTLNDGHDPRTGKRLGPATGKGEAFITFDALMAAYCEQLRYFVDVKIRGSNVIEQLYATLMPAPFLSLVIDDCIKSAKDYNAGGARYNTSYIQGVGIGSITDMLSALKHHVYEQQTLTMDRMLQALASDFAADEPLRLLVANKTPRYGNDHAFADSLMEQVFNMFHDAVTGRVTRRGATYRINMLPTTCHVYFGSVVGATPDGRKARMPLSEGISPVQGADRLGPTAVIKSAAKMDHLRTGGTLLNQKFSPSMLAGQEGLDRLTHLIRAYFRLDGHHIQFNVIDASTLRAAQQRPEDHQGLIVRVAGYSDYFHNLSRALQDEIIARTEHSAI